MSTIAVMAMFFASHINALRFVKIERDRNILRTLAALEGRKL